MAGAAYAPLPQQPPPGDGAASDDNPDDVASPEVAANAEAEARRLASALDRHFLLWGLLAIIIGPATLPICRRRHGALSHYVAPTPARGTVSPVAVAAWLGALLGLTLHGIALLAVWFTDAGGLSQVPYLGIGLGAYALIIPAAAVPGYFLVRKQHADLLEPVEATELYALRCSVRDCLACGAGELFDTQGLPEPPDGTVPGEHVRRVAERLNLLHGALRDVGCWVRWLVGGVGVLAAVTLLVSSYLAGREDRLLWAVPCACVEASAVAVFYLSFYFEHSVFCRRADCILRVANSHRRLVRGNLAWVLRRTHLTRVVRLKLVVRNRHVRDLRNRAGERWWEAFPYLDPEFRAAARVLLLVNLRRAASVRHRGLPYGRALYGSAWLPADALLLALGFAAPFGSAAVLRPRRTLRFIAIV